MIKLFSKNSFSWWTLILFIATILVTIDFFSNKGAIETIRQAELQHEYPKSEVLTSKPIVEGDSDCVSLSSVDFIDKDTGWIIADEFHSDVKSSRILRTEDGGLNWEKIAMINMALKKLCFVTKTSGWAIADDLSGDVKVLFTQDGGISWNSQLEEKISQSSDFDLWFQDTTSGYALMGGKLFSTKDSGSHWSQISYNINGFVPQHMSFSNYDTGWLVGGVHGNNSENKLAVLHTSDGGQSWNKQFEKTYSDGPAGSIDIDFINSSAGWFLTSNMATWAGELYSTSDGGVNWSKINEIKCVRPSPQELHFVTKQIGWIPLNVGAGPIAGGLMFTKDGGKSFNTIGSEDKMSSAKEVYFTSEQHGYAVLTEINYGDYLMETADGGKTWSQIYPQVRPIKDISFVDNLHGFGLSKLSDSRALLSTTDGGDTWSEVYTFDENLAPLMLSFINREHGWLLAYGDGNKLVIVNTTDGGRTWALLNDDIFQTSSYSPSYIKFFNVSEGIMMAANGDSTAICRTSDGGKTWEAAKITLPNNINMFSFVSNNLGYMVSTSGRSPYSVELSRIEDEKNLKQLYQIPSNAFSYGIDFVSKNKGYILIETSPFTQNSRLELWITNDGGLTWAQNKFPEGFQLELLLSQLPFQFTDDKHGWILAANGLLKTDDGGKTWNWR